MPKENTVSKSTPVTPAPIAKPGVPSKVELSTPVAVSAPAVVATATLAAAIVAPPKAPVADAAALIRALHDPSADKACVAAQSLGKLGDSAAVLPLSEVVANANGYFHSVVRAAACASLGQLGDRRAIPALLTAVSDSMAEASAEAVRALAALGDERAIEPLIAVLRNERGFFLPVVRLAAVTALRQFKTPAAAAALKTLAANAKEDAVLRSAAA